MTGRQDAHSPFEQAPAFMAEKRIAHYELLDEIGKGGMGIVYKARDTRLERQAAIKALPEELAEDSERLARFEREAQLLASLNNSYIATVYGLEEVEGRRFLAMELVEGESLAERLSKGAIPVRKALELARQIAEALEVAHKADVVHRDVKPANIMIDQDGKAKVLDFGLAKTHRPDTREADPGLSPTLTQPLTRAGYVLGTPVYMSPEQAAGEEAGKQSDIWSFGCVLFEMLAGKRACTAPAVDAGRITPDWDALPKETPRQARSLIRRCLQENLRRRLHDIADARIELEEILVESETGALETERALSGAEGSRRTPRTWWLLLGGMALVGLAGGLVLGPAVAPKVESPVRRFEILTADLQPISAGGGRMVAISTDGTRVAFVDRSQLYIRDLVGGETRAVPESGHGIAPFFSPDGDWLVYTSGGGGVARKVWVEGGESFVICSARASGLFGGTWGEDERIIFSDGRSLRTVDADGADCRPFGEQHRDPAHSYRDPQLLPGGEQLLVELVEDGGENGPERSIAMLSTLSGELLDVIVRDAGSPRYVDPGFLTFLRGNTMFALEFDSHSRTISGEPVPVIQDVAFNLNAHMDVSSEGTMVYVPARGTPELELTWVDREGREEPLRLDPASYYTPRLSPDDDRVAVVIRRSGGSDLFLVDPARATREPFVRDSLWPAWIPNRSRLAFVTYREPPTALWWRPLQGDGAAERIGPRTEFGFYVLSVSEDPMVFTFYETRTVGGRDILVMRPGEEPVTLVATPGEDKAPRLSSDARYLAYASDWSGQEQVYVRTCRPCRPDLDLGERRWQLSSNGGTAPVWSRDGTEIFYLEGRKMMAVAVRTDPIFEAGEPRLLFESDHIADPFGNPNYDVAADGRFIMIRSVGSEASRHHLNVVVNWSREVKERLAAIR